MCAAAEGMHQPSSNPFCPFWTPLWISPARQCRPATGPGPVACTVSTQGGAVCVRGIVFLGVCCLLQIGAGLSSVSMAPLVIVCSSRRGAPTVFKSVLPVLPVLDATLDQPGTAMQTRHRPGARGVHGVDSGWSGVCAWFCVILSVLPVSDWVCAVQCQHGTSGDCV